ncbi:MAG: DUF350 domain-containing protein [Gammaproteobacteria bacterium]|nr:DUF350 domain-containing protein [Gammaproteobacteria bacterium]
MSGEGGLASELAFRIGGLVALVIAELRYDRVTSYDLHDQIERGNVAVAVAFAGVVVGFGNVMRMAGEGDFVSWNASLTEFGYYTTVGLVLLPLVRVLADKVLLPGASLSDELLQDSPNLDAGVIEASTYVVASNADRPDALTCPPADGHAHHRRAPARDAPGLPAPGEPVPADGRDRGADQFQTKVADLKRQIARCENNLVTLRVCPRTASSMSKTSALSMPSSTVGPTS